MGKIPNLTNIFPRGWNHQPVVVVSKQLPVFFAGQKTNMGEAAARDFVTTSSRVTSVASSEADFFEKKTRETAKQKKHKQCGWFSLGIQSPSENGNGS